MAYASDGALPRDTLGVPAEGVYIPNVGTIASAGGAVSTDSTGTPYAPALVSQSASQSVSGTLQNAAAANGNGTNFGVLGMATAILLVNMAGFTGTVTFKGSADGTNFSNLSATQLGTTTIATSTTGSASTTIQAWEISCAGLSYIQAPVSGFSVGTVTVTGYAVPVPFPTRTIQANLLAGAALIGTVEVADSAGSNKLAVDSSGNASVNIGKIGGVAASSLGTVIVQQAKSNAAVAAGTGTTPVTVKASAGYLKLFVVTTTATAAMTFYDNASAASGTVLYTTASNIAAGTIIVLDMPFANGLTLSQASGSAAVTISLI